MIVLDTNVISEPLRPTPENRVTEWINAQVLETLYLSAITVAEARFGLATAAANGMMVATRDVSPFKAAGLDVINPWLLQ